MNTRKLSFFALLQIVFIVIILSGCNATRSEIRSAVETYLDQWARDNKSPYEIHKFDYTEYGDKRVTALVVVFVDDPNIASSISSYMTPREFIFDVYEIGDEWIAEPERDEFWPFDVKILYWDSTNGGVCEEKISPGLDDDICLEITNNGNFDWKFPREELGWGGYGWGGNSGIYYDIEIGHQSDNKVIRYSTTYTFESLSSNKGTPFGLHDKDMWLFLMPSPLP